MITGAVRIPKLFWVLDGLKVPRDPWISSSDPYFQEAKNSFQFYFEEVRKQEAQGVVDRTDIINLLMSAWALRHNWRSNRDLDLRKRIQECGAIAKKYGLTKIWDAGYYSTMIRRLEDKVRIDHEGRRVSNCGHCGRELTAELSVKRGVGPVCFHKRGP
jgi:hypothetical protein